MKAFTQAWGTDLVARRLFFAAGAVKFEDIGGMLGASHSVK